MMNNNFDSDTNVRYKTCAILFGGIGGASAGYMRSQLEYGGKLYRFKILCSIDYDSVACQNHDQITGEQSSVVMDLFTRQQYIDWHGHEPPPEWREVEPWDIWVAFGCQVPYFLFTSPPCKGLSALLPKKSSESRKYQALNHLTVRGLDLALRACLEYGGELPAIIQLENVPRIQTRGKALLKQIETRLKKDGYAVNMRADHNLGEIGGLGQSRMRFLIMARQESQVPNFIYYPEKKKMKSIGDVLGPLPLPGDTDNGGPMHREPRLTWKVAMRLALIEAGKDWRSLEDMDWWNYKIDYEPRSGAYAVENWDAPSRTITGGAGPGRSNGAAAVADYRLSYKEGTHRNIYRVIKYDETCPTVTGAIGPNNGAVCISDTRYAGQNQKGVYRIVPADNLGGESIDIEDPTLGCSPRSGTFGVQRWEDTSVTITGSMDVHAGAAAVAEPRIPDDNDRGVWIIISLDGTRHRPITTYELAMLQGFDTHLPDGRPFQLVGCSDSKSREYIGNCVPVQAAQEMGNTILLAAAQAEEGVMFTLGLESVWVAPVEVEHQTTMVH